MEDVINRNGEIISSHLGDDIEGDIAVEEEQLSDPDIDNNEIIVPFDPTKIDVDIANVNLGLLIEELEDGIIDLSPDFQRASNVWDNVKKSRLIESILLGLPLPSFYFSEDPNTKKLAIIDGLQRICAIKEFVIDKKLRLDRLQFLDTFNGKYYNDLARHEKRRISSLKITRNTLRKDTPHDVKYVIFQRVNTGGVPLVAQEMRHALNQGRAAQFVAELANLSSFKQATDNSVKAKRMQDRDFVTRFIAFYLAYDEYAGELDAFLNAQMGKLNKMNEKNLDQLKYIFDHSMNCCYEIFYNDAFRRRYNKEDRRKPISKSLFDTISVNMAWLNESERDQLVERRERVIDMMIRIFNEGNFDKSISTATGSKSSVIARFNIIKDNFRAILNHDY